MIVIGPAEVSELFAGHSPIGADVKVNGTDSQVIGVTAGKGAAGSSTSGG